MPLASTATKSIPMRGSWAWVSQAMTRATAACSTVTTTSSLRRSNRSAAMPPTGESRKRGPSWASVISPTSVDEPVMLKTKAARTTVCIQLPMLETSAAR